MKANKPGDNFFYHNKVSIKREYGYYNGKWRDGYFMRYWRHGPIFNVYKTKGHALRSLPDCIKIRERAYTLAGKRMEMKADYV